MSLISKVKYKKNKGMTLIEIVISVALLAILFIPISSIILSLLKVGVKTENKQQATYLGQSVLDELSAIEKITIQNEGENSYFKLLDGGKVYKENDDLYKGSFISKYKNSDKYVSEVTLNKVSTAEIEGVNNLIKYSDFAWRLTFSDDSKYCLESLWSIEEEKISSNPLKIEISKNMNIKLNDNYYTSKGEVKNTLVIYLQNGEVKDYQSVKINNNSEEFINVYVIKENLDSKINITVTGKQVNIYNLSLVEENLNGEMYEIAVVIKDKDNGNILFKGNTISKVIFK